VNQLEAKREVSEKLEKLNQAKEKIERMQREIEEMKEQKITHYGKTHHTRILARTEEPRKKISSWLMESRNSWIQNHRSQ
jgi:FtsZ-binding cell division protein ZapB